MHTFFHTPLVPVGQILTLPEEESKHIRAMRLHKGDLVWVVDGAGHRAKAEIIAPSGKAAELKLLEVTEQFPRRKAKIHIAVAPTKNNDRLEFFIEKAIENGIDKISLFRSANSERLKLRPERLHRKAIAAMKQSGQALLPEVSALHEFEELLTYPDTQRFIAWVQAPDTALLQHLAEPEKDTLVLIGPEGGFTKPEVEAALAAGFQAVSLGENRLRTETAALTACLTLHFLNA